MALITVSGSAARSFVIPAASSQAYQFYSSLPRIVPFLPRIELIASAPHDVYRIAYRSLELGLYEVDIRCDLQVFTVAEPKTLRIKPAEVSPFMALRPKATLRSCTAMGRFEIVSQFTAVEAFQTEVAYQLALSAQLPKPMGLALVPAAAIQAAVDRIVQMRITEIVDRFIADSTAAFIESLANR